jgi:hypothetical protein
VCQRGEECTLKEFCGFRDAVCSEQPRCDGRFPRTNRKGEFVGRTD